MQMKIIVESQNDYDTWMAEQKTFKEFVMGGDSQPATDAGETASIEQ